MRISTQPQRCAKPHVALELRTSTIRENEAIYAGADNLTTVTQRLKDEKRSRRISRAFPSVKMLRVWSYRDISTCGSFNPENPGVAYKDMGRLERTRRRNIRYIERTRFGANGKSDAIAPPEMMGEWPRIDEHVHAGRYRIPR